MKLKFLSVGAVSALLMLAACSGSNSKPGKAIEESHPATQADSLSYYLGLSVSGAYWQASQQDSTLKGAEGQQAYLAGFQDGLKALDGREDAYKQAYMLGIQMAMQIDNTKKELGLTINPTMFTDGFGYGLRADSLGKSQKVQTYIQTTIESVQQKKKEADSKAAAAKLKSLTKQGYTQVNPTLYKKAIKPATGAALKKGDKVAATLTMRDSKGKELQPQNTQDIVIGEGYLAESPIGKTIETMSMGESATFAIPVADLYGGRASQMGLENTDFVLLDIAIAPAGTKAEEPKAEATQAGQAVPPSAAPAPKK